MIHLKYLLFGLAFIAVTGVGAVAIVAALFYSGKLICLILGAAVTVYIAHGIGRVAIAPKLSKNREHTLNRI